MPRSNRVYSSVPEYWYNRPDYNGAKMKEKGSMKAQKNLKKIWYNRKMRILNLSCTELYNPTGKSKIDRTIVANK